MNPPGLDAEAQLILDANAVGSDDETVRRRSRAVSEMRSQTTPISSWLAAAAMLLLSVAVVAATFLASDRAGNLPAWRQALATTATVVGVAWLFVAAAPVIRRMRARSREQAVKVALGSRQQRRLLRQIHGHRPVEPALLVVSRPLAQRVATIGAGWKTFGAVAIAMVGQLARSHTVLVGLLTSVAVFGFALAAWGMRRDSRRAQRFLAAHPLPAGGLA